MKAESGCFLDEERKGFIWTVKEAPSRRLHVAVFTLVIWVFAGKHGSPLSVTESWKTPEGALGSRFRAAQPQSSPVTLQHNRESFAGPASLHQLPEFKW
jgi:hypothetical protein